MTNRQAIDKDIKDWHARYPEHVSRLAKEASESPRMEGTRRQMKEYKNWWNLERR